jgi:enterochelin esterase-like enzyme
MFSLINPVAWIESAINAGFERDVARRLLGTSVSATISFLWALRTLPLFGRACAAAATAMYLNLTRQPLGNFSALTVPADLMSPDNTAQYITISEGKQ